MHVYVCIIYLSAISLSVLDRKIDSPELLLLARRTLHSFRNEHASWAKRRAYYRYYWFSLL